MSRWYPLAPCGPAFFDTAAHVHRFVHELPVPPEQVWASLVSPHSVADWTPLLSSIEWTSALGLGATRTVRLPLGALTLREHFFRWEEGTRYSFHGTEANRPLLHRMAEDYLVEPTPGGTRFTWTFATEGGPRTGGLLRLLDPVAGLAFGRMAAGSTRYFRA